MTAFVASASKATRQLLRQYPWLETPAVISAPMRVIAGPSLAVQVSLSGGLGFIGPPAKPANLLTDLDEARKLIATSTSASLKKVTDNDRLPIGIGFQTWNSNLDAALSAVSQYSPSAVWLFAPRHGQSELDEWTQQIRTTSPKTRIWIQVGTLTEAVAAADSSSAPDTLVVQGAEAGGHGRANDGMGLIALLPEVADATRDSGIPVVAAGGIVDGRGAAAALSLGAAGVAMGTRFLASREARISKGYQDEVVRASDGAKSTVRTQLYNHLRGTFDWPEEFSPRGLINRSWVDHCEGVEFDELKEKHDEVIKSGDAAWGLEGRTASYAGAAVGLIQGVEDAARIVRGVQRDAMEILKGLAAASHDS